MTSVMGAGVSTSSNFSSITQPGGSAKRFIGARSGGDAVKSTSGSQRRKYGLYGAGCPGRGGSPYAAVVLAVEAPPLMPALATCTVHRAICTGRRGSKSWQPMATAFGRSASEREPAKRVVTLGAQSRSSGTQKRDWLLTLRGGDAGMTIGFASSVPLKRPQYWSPR